MEKSVHRREITRKESASHNIVFNKPNSRRKIYEKYPIGEPVTRENFTEMFINSFAVSRGALAAQVAYLEWLRIHLKFDYRTTLANFRDAGCLESLSDPEQERFENEFMRVKGHRKLRLDIALPHLITQLLRPEYLELSQKYFAPEKAQSRAELMEALNEGINRLKQEDKNH